MKVKISLVCILVGMLLVASIAPLVAAQRTGEARASLQTLAQGPVPANVDIGWLEGHAYWNPLNVVMEADWVFCYLMYSTLFMYDEDLNQTVPSLALDYQQVIETDLSVSTYINISSSAYFRNIDDLASTAHQLTAEDVAYTIQLIKDNNGGAWVSHVADISSIEVTGTFQVKIVNDHVDCTLISDLAWVPIIPKYMWETLPGSQILSAKSPQWLVGSGPFVYNSSMTDVFYKFDRAPNYHGAADFGDERAVQVDSVTFECYSNADVLAIDLKSGIIDCACLSSSIDEYLNLSVGATADVTKYVTAGLGIYDAAINAIPMDFRTGTYGKGNPILLDPTVRKAILMTLDKDQIVNEIMDGLGTRADSILAPGFWHKDIDGEIPYDPAAAHDLLVQNGYNDTDMDGTLECGPASLPVQEGWAAQGTELTFRLQAPDSDPLYGAIGAAWAEMAQGSGMTLNFELKSEAIMINTAWYKADYDIWVWTWYWTPEPLDALSTWETSGIRTGGDNCQSPMGPWWYGPSNQSASPTGTPYSSFDENMSLAERELDVDERKQIVDSMQQMIYDSYTETPPAYSIELYGMLEERYTGWGNWTQHVGRAILSQLPWVWFDLVPVINEPPVASFSVTPLAGDTTTVFEFNASLSSDTEDPVDSLDVRWDWENDGIWDTSWDTAKVATHQYSVDGTYTAVLEVRDSDGATDNATVDISVVMIPEFSSVVLPVFILLGAMAIAIWRARRP